MVFHYNCLSGLWGIGASNLYRGPKQHMHFQQPEIVRKKPWRTQCATGPVLAQTGFLTFVNLPASKPNNSQKINLVTSKWTVTKLWFRWQIWSNARLKALRNAARQLRNWIHRWQNIKMGSPIANSFIYIWLKGLCSMGWWVKQCLPMSYF